MKTSLRFGLAVACIVFGATSNVLGQPPLITHITVNNSQVRCLADARWFGINTAILGLGFFQRLITPRLLNQAGIGTLRFPGGSASDEYHWASNTSDSNTWTWATSFTAFAKVATNMHAQTVITVNYGTGSSNEAAAWVKSADNTNHYGFKYWEVGNE